MTLPLMGHPIQSILKLFQENGGLLDEAEEKAFENQYNSEDEILPEYSVENSNISLPNVFKRLPTTITNPSNNSDLDWNFAQTPTFDSILSDVPIESYFWLVIFCLIFIIGLIGNGLLVLIFMKHRLLRNVSNMYFVNLAAGDLLFIAFGIPSTAILYMVPTLQWPFTLLVCKLSEVAKSLSFGVSIFTLTALTADRYLAITNPMRKLTGYKARRTTKMFMSAVWILSSCIAFPALLFADVRKFPVNENNSNWNQSIGFESFSPYCHPYPKEFGPSYAKITIIVQFMLLYVAPLLFILILFLLMAHHMVLTTRSMPGDMLGLGKHIEDRKKVLWEKVAAITLALVGVFAICFLPHHLFNIGIYFDPKSRHSLNILWNIIRMVSIFLTSANACVHPVTLFIISRDFRKKFSRRMLKCKFND